ncbi:MAG: dihydropteroate synthase [Gammaproteobacteria bacterium]|nr:dihydropteroate synthase [Gammaproteobacteria bacterium]
MIDSAVGITLDTSKPQLMGILNVTPDSFSDGGLFVGHNKALTHVELMIEQGACIIDIGGESTRPGAKTVSIDNEIQRVVPIIEAIRASSQYTVATIPISIDSSKPEVMAAALAAGASMINDVRALTLPGALEVAANSDVPICLMHAQGSSKTMQSDPQYNDVVADVMGFLQKRVSVCVEAGITRDRLIIDPGFGFGKTLNHNLALAQNLDRFQSLSLPILVGVSRKSMFGAILNAEVDERLYGSLAMTALLLNKGASIVRTHDVAATRDAIKVVTAMLDTTI